MPRRVRTFVVTREGRDKGKTFTLKEAPADQVERWCYRVGLAIAAAGTRLPEGMLDGAAGLRFTFQAILVAGLQSLAGLKWEDARPLLDEMVPLIRYCPAPGSPEQVIFPGENSQIEEVATWMEIRKELVELHLGFSVTVGESTSASSSTPAPPVAEPR